MPVAETQIIVVAIDHTKRSGIILNNRGMLVRIFKISTSVVLVTLTFACSLADAVALAVLLLCFFCSPFKKSRRTRNESAPKETNSDVFLVHLLVHFLNISI